MRYVRVISGALAQLRSLPAEDAPRHCVLADAGYGIDSAFRQAFAIASPRCVRNAGKAGLHTLQSPRIEWPVGDEPL